MLGYVEPEAAANALSLRIYDFLIWPIRFEDEQHGALFVRRYLEGPQALWQQTQDKIFSVPKLWDVTKIADEHLHLLKRIVGWTQDLDNITNALDLATLRKLIAASVPLWKTRGPEDAMIRVLTLATGARARAWNWFDFRWLVGERGFEEARNGLDPWLLVAPGLPNNEEYLSNVRIVDNGALNRTLVVNLVKLMRAIGERIEISYIDFLDTFTVEADVSQWDVGAGDQMTVTGGAGHLENSTQRQVTIVGADSASAWGDLIAYVRVGAQSLASGATFGLVFCYQDEDNYYAFKLDTVDESLTFSQVVAGVETVLDTRPIGSLGRLWPNTGYGLRVQTTYVEPNFYIKLFWDGMPIFDWVLSSPTFYTGTFGVYHDANVSGCFFDEAEAFELPLETTLVDINS
jgi:hypothetical protein